MSLQNESQIDFPLPISQRNSPGPICRRRFTPLDSPTQLCRKLTKLQIGIEEVPVIHTHTVEFRVADDYVDTADVAILFPRKMRLFGSISAEAPSPLQKISCTVIDEGARCTMGPQKQE